jgi:hypothetical protein
VVIKKEKFQVLHFREGLLALPANIRPGWKGLPGINGAMVFGRVLFGRLKIGHLLL